MHSERLATSLLRNGSVKTEKCKNFQERKQGATLTQFYDFESYHDKKQWKEPPVSLTYETTHVPVSVSIGDMLERKPFWVWNQAVIITWQHNQVLEVLVSAV